MPAVIDALKAIIDRGNGIASPSRYLVFIQFPLAIASAFSQIDKVIFLTEITELPGRQIATTPQTIYGVARKMPYGVVYNDLPVTFLCTNDMAIRTVFDQWHTAITDPTNNYFNYYDNYVGRIYLNKLDEQMNITYNVVLDEVYPVTIEPQPLDAGAVDQYLRLNVQFAYRRWRSFEDFARGGEAFSFDPGAVFDGGGSLVLYPPIPNKLFPTTPPSPFED